MRISLPILILVLSIAAFEVATAAPIDLPHQYQGVPVKEDPAEIAMWGQGDSFEDIFDSVTVRASSTLAPEGGNRYDAACLHDGNLKTAWVEGAKGDGVNEYVEMKLRMTPETHIDPAIRGMTLFNGYRKSRALWKDNNRIKRLRLSVNGKPYATLTLADCYEEQHVDLGHISLPQPPRDTVLRFTIESVYPGAKHHDTALSEIQFDGSGIY